MEKEEKRNLRSETYKMLCNKKEQELKEAGNDVNKCLRIAFETWVASWRLWSDLDMQQESILQFSDFYGRLMQEQEQRLFQEMQEELSDACNKAEQISRKQELWMTGLMDKVFAREQDGKNFFGGEEAYAQMRMLWEGGELMERLKEYIYTDINARGDNVDDILQGLLG